MNDFAQYLQIGIVEFIETRGGVDAAADELHSYITGEAADNTATYDPEGAEEMRKTDYGAVLRWLQQYEPDKE